MTAPALLPPPPPTNGLRWITRAGERELDTGMSFGLLTLSAGERYAGESGGERALLLIDGEVELEWSGGSGVAARNSLFDQRPIVLHVDGETRFEIAASSEAELAWIETANARRFEPKLFDGDAMLEEDRRGEGRVDDAAFRLVRTVFDDRNRPEANLVLGEVVNLPGRWSSWPPHHHPHPELYHYRFDRPEGYGHAELGDAVYRVGAGDTLKIVGAVDHAQVAAPGYAMWYLWAIRHLEGERYTVPEFTDAHRWTMAPGAAAWRPRGGSA